MSIKLMNPRDVERQAWRLFETRFVRKAEAPDCQQRIDDQLADKIDELTPGGGNFGNLRRIVTQASELWESRSQLRKRDVLYLAAALLYFISPLDAVPDILPGIGYVDDLIILSAVVGLVLEVVSALRPQGKEKNQKCIDRGTETSLKRCDRSPGGGVLRVVAAVAVLWGTALAVTISLSVATVLGRFPAEWLTYVVLSTALVLGCNVMMVAIYFWRKYRSSKWPKRLRALLASKLKLLHFVASSFSLVVQMGFESGRFLLGLPRQLFRLPKEASHSRVSSVS